MKLSELKLSVLDVGVIRNNQSAANAFSSMVALAQHAERLGYHRYWLGEHQCYPDRVDLGLGSSSGADGITTALLRRLMRNLFASY